MKNRSLINLLAAAALLATSGCASLSKDECLSANWEDIGIRDGANGQPAAIRVIGTDQPTRLITAIDAVARRRFVRIITHYVL